MFWYLLLGLATGARTMTATAVLSWFAWTGLCNAAGGNERGERGLGPVSLQRLRATVYGWLPRLPTERILLRGDEPGDGSLDRPWRGGYA